MLTLVLIATFGAWVGFSNTLFHFPLAALAFPLGVTWIGLRATSWRKGLQFGWLAGWMAAIGCLYWVIVPVQNYGGMPWYIALPCPILLSAIMALYYGVYAVIIHYAGARMTGVPLCLFAGACWASMEMLMGTILSGFPWMNLASAFVPWPIAMQGVSILGAYGYSGLLTALAVAILLYSTYRSALFFAIGIATLIVGFGAWRTTVDFGQPDHTMTIVQGNVDQGVKWKPEYQAKTVNKYITLSRQAIERHDPIVVIWPETSMPFYLQEENLFRSSVQALATQTKTSVLTGSPAYHVTNPETRTFDLYNRAWLMDVQGRTEQSYDKEHLVPFGEYMPMEQWVPFEKLVDAAGNFVPGTQNKPLVLDGVALGMLICYEGIFSDLAQKQVERGATALVNISNDAWFGTTSAPGQHFNLTILRAVEQGRWLVRSTNTGISAFVDPAGRITAVAPQFEATTLSSAIASRDEKTVYHRIYHFLRPTIYLLTLAGIVYILVGARKKKKAKSL